MSFQGGVLAEMRVKLRPRTSARERNNFRVSAKYSRDMLVRSAEKQRLGGSMLLLDKVGGAKYL